MRCDPLKVAAACVRELADGAAGSLAGAQGRELALAAEPLGSRRRL
jgi:hypothetical protein